MRYSIKFPMSDNWRPKTLIGITIKEIKPIKVRQVNKNGFVFDYCEGIISSEDAMLLKLKGEDYRIRPLSDK